MAITPIQVSSTSQRKMSPLEKVALALSIAEKTLGIGLSVPRFLQEREQAKTQERAAGLSAAEKFIGIRRAAAEMEPVPEQQAARIEERTGFRPKFRFEAASLAPKTVEKEIREKGRLTDIEKKVFDAYTEDFNIAAPGEQPRFELDIAGRRIGFVDKPVGQLAEEKKELPPNTILKVNEGNAIPLMLDNIERVIQKNTDLFGPIEGAVRSVNPYDTRAQSVDAEMRAASQAFGRFMEGGVLRKEDEAKYRRMFPKLSDKPEVASTKLNVVRKLLRTKQQSDIEAFEAQGFDLRGLQLPSPEEVRSTVEQGAPSLKEAEEF